MRTLSLLRPILIYGLLVVGSLIFTFPFVWMATTSAKVDREIYPEKLRLSPITPIPRLLSPYVDDRYYPPPASKRAEEIMRHLVPLLRQSGFKIPADIRSEDAEPQLARGLYKQLSRRLPEEVWNGPLPALVTAARKEMTADSVRETFDTIYRRLAFGRVLARNQDLVEEELGKGKPFSRRFTNLTPNAAVLTDRVEKKQSCALVSYNFRSASKLVLQQTFTTDFPISTLKRIKLYLCPDDTWQELWLTVEKDGKCYVARRPAILANFNWMTVSWQEPSEDDSSLMAKTWILLDRQQNGSDITDPHQLRLTFELRKCNQQQAWIHKLGYNYREVFNQIPFWRYLRVSVFLVIANIVLALLASSLIGYAFARLQWPGRDFCFVLMLATMMIPSQVTMIPHFLIWKNVGAYDTLTPLWFGSAFGSAFFIFLIRQNLKGIPRDLEDAALIDGCGYLRIYWHIMLPLVRPCLAAIAIFTFMASWNDFMGPLIYLADQRIYPLAFGLYAFSVMMSDPPVMMAASLLMTLPVILIFFFAQKYFIQGVTMTGIKG